MKVLNADDVYRIMQQVLLRENKIRRNQEHYWAIGLDNRHKILFIELISLGAVNRVHVAPPEVFRMAIYKLAVRMILVHNHPSGGLSPSADDKDHTDRMIKSGDMLNIEVLDHLIINEETFFSFQAGGIIDELRKSGRYELVEREKEAIREMKMAVEREKARLDNSMEIARKMLKDGIDIDTIKKYTGLNKREIKQL